MPGGAAIRYYQRIMGDWPKLCVKMIHDDPNTPIDLWAACVVRLSDNVKAIQDVIHETDGLPQQPVKHDLTFTNGIDITFHKTGG